MYHDKSKIMTYLDGQFTLMSSDIERLLTNECELNTKIDLFRVIFRLTITVEFN